MSDKKNEFAAQQQALRAEAEAQLVAAEPVARPVPALNFDELLHELRVHQIELEMQNEELRRAHLALEQSRAHYVELYDFAPVGYLTLNADGVITEINLTAANLLGVERNHNLINRRFAQFIGDQYKDLWYRHFMHAKQSNGRYACELPFQFENRPVSYFHLDCLYIGTDDYPTLRITLTDVTERKQAETAIREHEDRDRLRLRLFIEQVPASIAMFDLDMHYLAASNRWKQEFSLFGDILGVSHCEVFPDIPEHWKQLHRRCLAGETLSATEEAFELPDGLIKWINWEASPWYSVDGQVGGILIAMEEITERKRVENLRIAAAAFETQEGILVTDADKVILRVNKAFSRITGFSAEEVIGKTPVILRSGLHNPGFYKAILDFLARDGYWQGEIWDKRKNGELVPLLQTITAVIDEAGQVTHYVGSMVDITLQKQAEKVLLDARERLENQVMVTNEELEKNKIEMAEINTTLNVLLRHRAADKSDARIAISEEVEATILPFLKKLQGLSMGRRSSSRLISILETNLKRLVEAHGHESNLLAVYQKLTPIETQVASMIKQGLPTKVIANTLNIAPGTVSIHRKHIRKKLGLDSKAINLYGYLMSLTE